MSQPPQIPKQRPPSDDPWPGRARSRKGCVKPAAMVLTVILAAALLVIATRYQGGPMTNLNDIAIWAVIYAWAAFLLLIVFGVVEWWLRRAEGKADDEAILEALGIANEDRQP